MELQSGTNIQDLQAIPLSSEGVKVVAVVPPADLHFSLKKLLSTTQHVTWFE